MTTQLAIVHHPKIWKTDTYYPTIGVNYSIVTCSLTRLNVPQPPLPFPIRNSFPHPCTSNFEIEGFIVERVSS